MAMVYKKDRDIVDKNHQSVTVYETRIYCTSHIK